MSNGSINIEKFNRIFVFQDTSYSQSESTSSDSTLTHELQVLYKLHAELKNYYVLLKIIRTDLEKITENFSVLKET